MDKERLSHIRCNDAHAVITYLWKYRHKWVEDKAISADTGVARNRLPVIYRNLRLRHGIDIVKSKNSYRLKGFINDTVK